MTRSKNELATDIVGATVKPKSYNYKLVDGTQVDDLDAPAGGWPKEFRPMVPERHVAKVHAVYLKSFEDGETCLMYLLVDPFGFTSEVFAKHVDFHLTQNGDIKLRP